MASQNPISVLNTFCQKSKAELTWEQDGGQSTGKWTVRATLSFADGTAEATQGLASTQKDAKGVAAQKLVTLLSGRGLLAEYNVDMSVPVEIGGGPPPAKKAKLGAVLQPGLVAAGPVTVPNVPLQRPLGAKVVPASQPPGAVGGGGPAAKHPLMMVNEFAQKRQCKLEWAWGPAPANPIAGGPWTVVLMIKRADGSTLGEMEATSNAKKDAQVKAACQYLETQGINPIAQLPGQQARLPPSIRAVDHGAAEGVPPHSLLMGSLDTPAPLPGADGLLEGSEAAFGYSAASARARLNEYLMKRKLTQDIPCDGPPMGPYVAQLEIPLARGRGAVWGESRAATKKDALKAVALKLIVELVKVGEVAPFATKQDGGLQGILPQSAAIKPGVEEQLDQLFAELGVAVNFEGVVNGNPNESIMQDFDAQPWATYPNCKAITWRPPAYGQDPWNADGSGKFSADEASANFQLQTELQHKETNYSYASIRNVRSQLPITAMNDHIMDLIDNNPVVLIAGSTGCGKTTQLPQMILERATLRGYATKTNIICTQPRRIAAITVAERVAKERGEAIGQSVGYKVRFASRVPRGYASVCYMTTGMLLRCLVSGGLNGVSHLIVDEVHERDLDTDFLITIIRLLLPKSPGLRVILMSATMDLEKWSAYFGTGFAVVEIPGRLFPVDIHYLEDAQRLVGMRPDGNVKYQQEDVPLDLVERMITHIVDNQGHDGRSGAILAFFPGWESIDATNKRLAKSSIARRIKVCLLHSKVSKEEQQAAFHQAPHGLVKVVLSTNIAESSVTITDVVYVIDSCRVKQLVPIHSGLGRTSYRLTNLPASKQNLQQRSGRAGRVQHGVCYRLLTKRDYEGLPFSLNPEMTRLPLHQVCLTLKSLNLGYCAKFLAMAPDAPHALSVKLAVKTLQDLKAFDSQERITSLGLKLAKLPIEPRMGFALLAACMLGLGEPLAVLSAFVNSPPLYQNESMRGKDLDKRGENVASMQLLSDHLDALQMYYRLKEHPEHEQVQICRREFVNFQSFKHISDVTDQTIMLLNSMDFPPETTVSCKEWVLQLGTAADTDAHRQLWSAMMFLTGLGVEHFAVRMGVGRKVYLGPSKKEAMRTSQMACSPGIPEAAPNDPTRPFVLFMDLRESEWSSSCRNVSCAGAVSTILGAARDLSYDNHHQCLMVDGWAPVAMSPHTAARMVSTRLALRSCLLNVAKSPSLLAQSAPIAHFKGLLFELVHPFDGEPWSAP